jgi:hypothetical protein
VVHSIAEAGYDPEGNPVRLCGLLRDVTELRGKERLLKKREEDRAILKKQRKSKG